jgi:DNA topoisomerase IB
MHARHAKSAPSPVRVAAKFQNKKKVKSQDGGETTIYEYGPRQVANRHKEKAERIQKFMPKLPDLRAAYKKGLGDKDPMKRLTALAVGLIDHTYERVGNVDSAEDNGHYGVTVWEVRHVKFKGDKAEISYTGKSGVKHNKTVSDAKLVSALKDATKGKKPEDRVLCDGDECVVNADDVNEYLEPYGITAKDLRGLHANDEVRAALKKIRSEGPELPRARKEKDKILKDEFKKAIEQAAEAVGHEASTLRSQYLAPVIEESYLHDGTVADRLDKKAGATVLVGGDDESKAWVQGFFRRHPKLARYSKVKVNRVFGVSGSSSHPEASVKLGVIHLYPKFWGLSPDIKDFVFAHEIGHAVNGDFSLVGAAEIVGGVDLWGDAEPLPFAQHNMGEAFADSFASYFIDGDVQRRYPAWARLVEYALATIKTATLEESEKEEREDKRLIQKDPKFKPPRQDLRRRDVEDRDTRGDDDSDEKQDKKDRSKNYKDASLIKRIVTRHLAVRVARQKGKKSEEESNRVKFLEQYGTKKVKNPVTDREVLLTTLASKTNPGEEKEYEVYEKEYQKWLESQKEKKKPSEEKPSEEKPAKPESESSPDSEEPKESKDPSPLLGALADSFATGKSKKIEEARKALLAEHPELSSEVKKHFDDYYAASKKLAEAAKLEPKAAVAAADKAEAEMKKSIESIRNIGKSEPEPAPAPAPAPESKPESKPDSKPVFNPMSRFSIPSDTSPSIGSPEEQAREDDKFAKSTYRELVKSKMPAKEAKGHADSLYAKITSLPEGSVAHAKASAAYNAIKIYQITQTSPDDKVEGISPYVANAIRAAHRMGLAQDFLDTSSDVGKTDAQKLQNLTSKAAVAYSNLTDEELAEFLPEKDPLKGIATSAFESYSAPAARKFIRDEVINALVGQFRFSELEGSSFNPELDQAKSELHDDLESITSKKKWFDDSKNLKAVRARIEAFNKLMADLWDKAKEYTKGVSMGTKLRREARAQSSRVASRYIENSGRYFIRDSY